MSDAIPPKAAAEALPAHDAAVAVEEDSDPDIDELDGSCKSDLTANSTDTIQMSLTNSRQTLRQHRKLSSLHPHNPRLQPQDLADPPSPKCHMGNFPPNRKMNSCPD